MSLLFVFLKGFVTSAGLIIAIGAQNAFVLSQGLKRQYPTELAVTCAGLDTVLIIAGVAGMGVLIQSSPVVLWIVTLVGALFLTGYGFRAAYAAFHATGLKTNGTALSSRKNAVLTCAALSLLNPHVYLDTVILIGSIGGALPAPEQPAFIVGACLASFVWFFCLSHGARFLSPYLTSSRSWQVLDGLIALMMFSISASLWMQLSTM